MPLCRAVSVYSWIENAVAIGIGDAEVNVASGGRERGARDSDRQLLEQF